MTSAESWINSHATVVSTSRQKFGSRSLTNFPICCRVIFPALLAFQRRIEAPERAGEPRERVFPLQPDPFRSPLQGLDTLL